MTGERKKYTIFEQAGLLVIIYTFLYFEIN